MSATPGDFDVIRAEVRRLCDKYGNEYWRGLEPDRYPEEFVGELTRQGWLAALIPEEYGGMGGGVLELCSVVEEISRACGGMGVGYAVNALGSFPNSVAGPDVQQQR